MELKDRIIEAVIEEFNEKGLKFTMDNVAKRLTISKRTLYSVIQDKEALFIEAIDYAFKDIKESENAIVLDTSLDIMEKLKKILIVLPLKYKMMDLRQLCELKDKFPRTYANLENHLENEWESTFQIMEQAMAEGRIKNIKLPVFQAIISGTIEYYLCKRILIDNEIEYEEALNQMLDIIMNGISL